MNVFIRSTGPLRRVSVVLLGVRVWRNSSHRQEMGCTRLEAINIFKEEEEEGKAT